MKRNQFPVPMYDRIIVDLFPSYTPKGGIVIPETVTQIVAEGVVVAVGEGYRNPQTGEIMPLKIKVGDKVKWPHTCGFKMDWGMTKEEARAYVCLREAEIMMILPNDYKINEVPVDPRQN